MRCHVLEQFESAWRSQRHEKGNTLHTEIQTLLTALDRERKRSRGILAICGVYTLITLVGSVFLFSTREVAVSEIWPVAAAQALAVVVLAYLVRTRFFGAPREPTSVREAAASALAETQSGIGQLKLTAIAIAAMLALLAIAVLSLSESGKMDGQSVSSFAAVCLVIALFNGMYLLLKWKRQLRPRRDRLSQIVRELDSQ